MAAQGVGSARSSKIYLVLFLVLSAIQIGCISTDDLTVQGGVYSCSTFTATVTCTVQGTSSPPYGTGGWIALLIPTGWSLDSVFCNGSGYTLELVPEGSFSEELTLYFYPPPPWYEWESFYTDQEVLVEEGDIWTGTLHVSTDGLVGSVELVALAATWGYEGINWSGDPCTTLVTVEEGFGLFQETWGAIKAGF